MLHHKTSSKGLSKQTVIGVLGSLLAFNTFAVDDFSALGENWIYASEKKGLNIVDSEQKSVFHIDGRYERLDIRSLTAKTTKHLVTATNKATNSLDIFLAEGDKLTLLDSQSVENDSIESVCLFNSERDAAIYAFILKGNSQLEQRLIYDLTSGEVKSNSVRYLPMSVELNDCAVDDTTSTLYVAENDIAVWSVGADPEATFHRKAVMIHAPHGNVTGELERLNVLDDGSLLATQSDANALIYQPSASDVKSLTLTENAEIIHGHWSSNRELIVTFFDDSKLTSVSANVSKNIRAKKSTFAQVTASAETTPVSLYGDAADDPAIWVNPISSNESLILGTDKKRGLAVYDLKGIERQFIAVGRINNVDVKNNINVAGKTLAIAAASHRDKNSITLFSIDYQTSLVNVIADIPTTLNDVYGLCMYSSKQQHYVFINDKDGRYQQYELLTSQSDVSGKLVREFRVDDQPEGCVANDVTGELFFGVEDHGIWVTGADPKYADAPRKIMGIEGKIKDDVEGMALYMGKTKTYLIVSSQGNDSYAVFNAKAPYEYIDSFQVALNKTTGIDGVSETDGLDVVSANLGGEYKQGMLVVQDGRNVLPTQPQNFKLVPFALIGKTLNIPLN